MHSECQIPILELPDEIVENIYDYIGPIERRTMRSMHPRLAEAELRSKYKVKRVRILLVSA